MKEGYNNKALMYRQVKDGELTYGEHIEAREYDGTGDPREAAARQVGGSHYTKHKIQPWNIINEYGLDFYRGNAIKYILRNKMDTREDIKKAIHYLEYWLEQEGGSN